MYKAALFDMDGVLIDSHDAWFERFNAGLQHFGQDPIGMEEFDAKIWAVSFKETVGDYFPGKTLEDIRSYYEETQDELIKLLKPMKNALETLEYIKGKGVKTAIVSNTQLVLVKAILTNAGLIDYFDVVIGGDMISEGKPNPEILFKALGELNLEPRDAFMIGDTVYDKGAAKNAKIDFVPFKFDNGINDLIELKEKC